MKRRAKKSGVRGLYILGLGVGRCKHDLYGSVSALFSSVRVEATFENKVFFISGVYLTNSFDFLSLENNLGTM